MPGPVTGTEAPAYAVYYVQATEEADAVKGSILRPQGYVWNRVVWAGDGGWEPPAGSQVTLDSALALPIGSIYTPQTD